MGIEQIKRCVMCAKEFSTWWPGPNLCKSCEESYQEIMGESK